MSGLPSTIWSIIFDYYVAVYKRITSTGETEQLSAELADIFWVVEVLSHESKIINHDTVKWYYSNILRNKQLGDSMWEQHLCIDQIVCKSKIQCLRWFAETFDLSKLIQYNTYAIIRHGCFDGKVKQIDYLHRKYTIPVEAFIVDNFYCIRYAYTYRHKRMLVWIFSNFLPIIKTKMIKDIETQILLFGATFDNIVNSVELKSPEKRKK